MAVVSFCNFWSDNSVDICHHCGESYKKHCDGHITDESYIPGLTWEELHILDTIRGLEKRSKINYTMESLAKKGFIRTDGRIRFTTRSGKDIIKLANKD